MYILPHLICINALMCHTILCTETMSLVQGLFTGSNMDFKVYLIS